MVAVGEPFFLGGGGGGGGLLLVTTLAYLNIIAANFQGILTAILQVIYTYINTTSSISIRYIYSRKSVI